MRPLRACLVLVFLLVSSAALAAVPAGFQETTYTSTALNAITGMAWAPDGSGRLFILHKTGRVLVATMQNGELATQNGSLVTTQFSADSVLTNSECGLIGIAFDPNFAVNRYVYLFVTVSTSEQQIIRYTDANGVGTARTVIVRGLPTVGQNHDGGALGFGLDGKLYWAIGDLGNGTGVDADLTSLASKVGRANPDGTPVNDNPFFDGPGPNNEYIWARGFRNPFTFNFQPGTGKLWVNSVGTSYEQVFVPNRGDHAGYNDYENNQPAGYITPVIAYRTNGTVSRTLAGVERRGGVVTFIATGVHGFRKGEKITVAGVGDPSFNGSFYVASTPGPSTNTWTAVQAGPDATSSGGTATTQNLGGSITGGVFYDSTLFPNEYRGNYFFGDYNSGVLVRSTLAGDGSVATVDAWGSGFNQAVDMDVGPDGALYVVGVTSRIVTRIKPPATGQKLIVSALNLPIVEGGKAIFTVRLAEAPTAGASITVNVQRASGDTDLTAESGAQLTFTQANWSTLQAVTLAAAEDADSDPDTASFTVAAQGLSTETVRLTSIDNNAPRLVLSTMSLALDEGGSSPFTVALSQAPARDITVTVARTAGDADVTITGGTALTFTPASWNTPQTVTVAAAEDADNVRDTATITVAAAGADARTVSVTVRDNEPSPPRITSTPVTTAVVGAPYRYEVVAEGYPAPTFSLTSSVQGPSIDASTGVITWTPAATGAVDLTVRASNGVSPDGEQTFRVTVKTDEPPRVVLTRPTQEERVSGTTAEFFGDCMDDVGCTRAEFYVDGVLASTDAQTSGHYHYGGEHNRWDTSSLRAGAHTVRMTVYDTRGQSTSAEVKVCVGDGPCVTPEPEEPVDSEGCGCGASAGGAVAWLALVLFLRRRGRS
jgi:glucose/arabinose dehydrogenase